MTSPSPTTAHRRARLGSGAALWACAIVAAIAAAALVGIATRNGSAISPDSATYVAGARNLVAGNGYSDFALVPITDWPPGLSVTLAALHGAGVGALTAARWLNAAALAAVVLLTFALGRRYLTRGWLALAAALIAGFAPAMLGVFSFIWSEPVFCALCLGVLLVLEPIARSPRASWWLITAAAVLAGAGFAYRYAGMTLVALTVIGVAVGAWGSGAERVIRRAGGALAIGLVVPALIVGRNLTHGSLTGQRIPSTATLHGVLDSSEHFLAGWLLADHHPGRSVGAVADRRRDRRLWRRGRPPVPRASACGTPAGRALVPPVVFVVGYALYILITEFQTMIDPPGDRICSPLLAPAAVLVMVAVDALLDRCPATHRDGVHRRRGHRARRLDRGDARHLGRPRTRVWPSGRALHGRRRQRRQLDGLRVHAGRDGDCRPGACCIPTNPAGSTWRPGASRSPTPGSPRRTRPFPWTARPPH